MDWKTIIAAEEPEGDEPESCNPSHVWLKIVFDGGMEDNPALLDSWPENADWLDWEMECAGLEALINRSHDEPWWQWAIRNGIAPGQEFIVRVERPTYERDYYGESDVDYGDWEIVGREPMTDDRAGRLWFAWIKDLDNRKIEICKP